MMSDVPPSIVLACARRKPRASVPRSIAVGEPRGAAALSALRVLALPRDAADALEVDGQLLQPLVELGRHELGDRPFGPDLGAALALRRRPLVVEPDEPALDVRLREALAGDRVGDALGGAREAATPGCRRRCRRSPSPAPESETRSFMSVVIATRQPSPSGPTRIESGTRTLSKNTSLNSASPVIWTQRSHVDPGRLHVDDEVRQPLVLRHRRGPCGRASIPHFARWASAGPHLLAVHDPLVSVANRPRRQAGDVGAGAGLAEHLAPDLLVGRERAQQTLPLLLAPPRDDGGAAHPDADDVEGPRHPVVVEHLVDDLGLRRARATARRRTPSATSASRSPASPKRTHHSA